MKTMPERNWKALTLLSIIIPVSVLATFKLAGIIQEPLGISETITLEDARWEFTRPSLTIGIGDKVESIYNDEISIVQSITIKYYSEENSSEYGLDFLALAVNVTATVAVGHIEEINLVFLENYENAQINIWIQHPLFQRENLSVTSSPATLSGKESILSLTGMNYPRVVRFWTPVHWVLGSPNTQMHQLEITSEITYSNGSLYKRIIQPFLLKLGSA